MHNVRLTGTGSTSGPGGPGGPCICRTRENGALVNTCEGKWNFNNHLQLVSLVER